MISNKDNNKKFFKSILYLFPLFLLIIQRHDYWRKIRNLKINFVLKVGSIPYENVYIYPYHILTFMCENFVGVARWTVIISGGAARWTEAISGGAAAEKKIHV